MKTYTTIAGDTFDKISLEQLGSEYLFPLLLQANQQYRHVLIFSSGIVLNIPEVDFDDHVEVPEWLTIDEDDYIAEEEENVPNPLEGEH